MNLLNRRHFIHMTGAACIVGATKVSAMTSLVPQQASRFPIRLGIVVQVRKGNTPKDVIARVRELGFPTCQVGFEEKISPEAAKPLKDALAQYDVEATAFLAFLPGRTVYNFYDGPLTIGLIPASTRRSRIDALKLAADIASECGIPAVHTHCGFVPENPNNSVYKRAVVSVREVAEYCKQKGRMFFCETGQETPITLLRVIEDVGLDNVFVNLDTANFILYDKGNPVDAMDVIGERVRGIHAKDGLFPTNPRNLGEEVPIGKGKVDFRRLLERLRDVNYHGAMTIERETEGQQQTKDILASKEFLEKIIAQVYDTPNGTSA